ncbi:MAG TPA: TadE/TadG family type IV pilus assembly protein [Anaerolineales bacterium]|nr:TadE/TadG family type IV pilus assembly protein [Anaerolineales bacterium]
MFIKKFHRQVHFAGFRAQAIVEFAIALPILMALLVGIFEVGRMVFIYSAVTNASREASRYGSAVGLDDTGSYAKYQYCDGIRAMARRSAYFLNLADSDILIEYDNGPSTSVFDTCTSNVDTAVHVNSGAEPDRVIVTISTDYSPMITLIPISSRTITSSSARTILGILDLNSGNSVVPTTGPTNTSAPTVPATALPSDTPTVKPTGPSDTPTATEPGGDLITFTPLPSSTMTDTPTITPTFTATFTPTMTFTPTVTFTPTTTSTPVPGCGNILAGTINTANSSNLMTMTITNPHDAVTVSNIHVTWNSTTGASGSKPLTLLSVSLGTTFWTGNSTAGSGLTITPSTTLTIPGNNRISTIIFSFDNKYHNPIGNSITINLSTIGCESNPIQRP